MALMEKQGRSFVTISVTAHHRTRRTPHKHHHLTTHRWHLHSIKAEVGRRKEAIEKGIETIIQSFCRWVIAFALNLLHPIRLSYSFLSKTISDSSCFSAQISISFPLFCIFSLCFTSNKSHHLLTWNGSVWCSSRKYRLQSTWKIISPIGRFEGHQQTQ